MNSVANKLTNEWQDVEWVLTDVDDTLTWQGKLPVQTIVALEQLQQAGIKVVAVSGACAGWCDHIAQVWPVDAVLGENGAFIMEKQNGYLTLRADRPMQEIEQQQAKLKQQVITILEGYPELNLTLDQSYRLCKVAIDTGQNRPRVDDATIEAVVAKIHALGAHATASSIHINAWYGEHSKKVTSLSYLADKGLSTQQILKQSCYVGDSMNDQLMFEALPKTVGVANIHHYWDKLSHRPAIVMSQPGGFGFAEFAQQLLAIKSMK